MSAPSSVLPARLPTAFHAWSAAATLSGFGDGALYFALGWAASGHGPHVVALVLTTTTAARSLLLLSGGVLTDRWGPRRTLIAGDAVLLVLTLVLAVVARLDGPSEVLLVATAAVLGVVDALVVPAGGALPRLLVEDDELPRALAARGSAGQAAALLGAPASGALVALVGLSGTALVDAVTFAVVVGVLVVVRPVHEVPRSGPARSGRHLRTRLLEVLHLVRQDPVLRTALTAVAVVAAAYLPVASLCVPLLARSQGWGAGAAGLLVGVAVAGSLAVSVVVARCGPLGTPLRVAAAGALVAAVGVTVLAATPGAPVAVAGLAVEGIGLGLFVSHIAPVVLGSAPRALAGRLQAVVATSQALPLVLVNPLLGALAAECGARSAVAACACALGLAALLLQRAR